MNRPLDKISLLDLELCNRNQQLPRIDMGIRKKNPSEYSTVLNAERRQSLVTEIYQQRASKKTNTCKLSENNQESGTPKY